MFFTNLVQFGSLTSENRRLVADQIGILQSLAHYTSLRSGPPPKYQRLVLQSDLEKLTQTQGQKVRNLASVFDPSRLSITFVSKRSNSRKCKRI